MQCCRHNTDQSKVRKQENANAERALAFTIATAQRASGHWIQNMRAVCRHCCCIALAWMSQANAQWSLMTVKMGAQCCKTHLIELYACELRIMPAGQALISEDAPNFIDLIKAADKQSLQSKLPASQQAGLAVLVTPV